MSLRGRVFLRNLALTFLLTVFLAWIGLRSIDLSIGFERSLGTVWGSLASNSSIWHFGNFLLELKTYFCECMNGTMWSTLPLLTKDCL